MQVSCHIVKLVLRNNALTTFHGIENLKSLEGLDVSYNIISNFSELEFLGCLPSLRSLWLEGNPLCCARWYRAQVFSFFTHPEKVSHTLHIFNFCDFFLLSFLNFKTPLFVWWIYWIIIFVTSISWFFSQFCAPAKLTNSLSLSLSLSLSPPCVMLCSGS
jgi:hypothetical protein